MEINDGNETAACLDLESITLPWEGGNMLSQQWGFVWIKIKSTCGYILPVLVVPNEKLKKKIFQPTRKSKK